MAAHNKPKKHRGTANPEYIAGMRLLRQSSAASPQESRPDRKRSRSVTKKAHINAGW